MASGHQQAYLNASEVIAASPSLDAASLDLPDPGGDALLVVELDGFGRVAARRTGDFTHVIASEGVGVALWHAPFWRAEGSELEELPELPPPDLPRALEVLADAPYGVREAVLDAALDGPVTLIEEDPERRAAWIAWIAAVLPDATFTTFAAQPIDVHVCATTPDHAGAFPGAIDTRVAATTQPSRFAAVAAAVAGRDPLVLGTERDPIALAVHGGATDLLKPEDLPRALELITALAKRGEIATAARAAAGFGAQTTALVRSPPILQELEVLAAVEPEPVDAEVVEEVEIVAWPVVEESMEDVEIVPEPEPVVWAPPVVEAEPEVVREDTFGGGLPLHDLEEAIEPGQSDGEQSLEELMAAFTSDPLEAPEEHAPQDEVVEEVEVGMSLSELEASLDVVEESEVGMSLEEFEASLKRERES